MIRRRSWTPNPCAVPGSPAFHPWTSGTTLSEIVWAYNSFTRKGCFSHRISPMTRKLTCSNSPHPVVESYVFLRICPFHVKFQMYCHIKLFLSYSLSFWMSVRKVVMWFLFSNKDFKLGFFFFLISLNVVSAVALESMSDKSNSYSICEVHFCSFVSTGLHPWSLLPPCAWFSLCAVQCIGTYILGKNL